MEVPPPKSHPPGRGGPGHVGAIFRSWALPQRFLDVVINFFGFFIDFEWILGGFGRVLEDFGGFWEGFNEIFRLFFVFLSKIAIL